MYNALVLISLLPLSGPDAGEHLAAVPRAETIQWVRSDVDPGDQIPVLPQSPSQSLPEGGIRTTVARLSDQFPLIPTQSTVPSTTPTPQRSTQRSSAPQLAQAIPESIPWTQDSTPVSAASANTQPVLPQSNLSHNPPQQNPVQQPAATVPPTFAAAPRDPNRIETHGLLEIPKWNNVTLSANNQSGAVLMTLRTEQRDGKGNIAKDASGQPILVPIVEGMKVYQGQLLGNLDDRTLQNRLRSAQAKLEVARAEMNKRIEVEYADWGFKTAQAELAMLKETNMMHENAISKMEILKSQLNVKQAGASLELAQYNLNEVKPKETRVQEEEVEAIRVEIELRKLVAPISGMVVKIDKAEGEWLREGEPILQIVQLATLRVKCDVIAKNYTTKMIEGKKATVYMPTLDGRMDEFAGKVVFVDPEVVAGERYETYVEVENRPDGNSWQLQPGRTVGITIHL